MLRHTLKKTLCSYIRMLKPIQYAHTMITLIKTGLCPHAHKHTLILHSYLSHSPHCFEHSWPLCFTYLSLSAAVVLWSFIQLGEAYTQFVCL